MTAATQAPAAGNGTIAKRAAAEPSRDITPGVSNLMDSARFAQLTEVAKVMAYVAPEHLRGKNRDVNIAWKETCSNCFRIANQALRWAMDPFAVMDETYVVKGKLGYGGKLVAGVVNSRASIHGELRVKYNTKSGDAFAAVIYGSPLEAIPKAANPLLVEYAEGESREALNVLDEMQIFAIRISVGQAKTDNQMWRNDPEQKLFYSGATKWARRHQPQLILGIVTDDDIERMQAVGSSGNGTSMVHRSALNDTLIPEGETAPDLSGVAPEAVPESAGDASGLGPVPEQVAPSDTSGPVNGQLSPEGALLSAKMDAAAGDLKQLTGVVLPEVVKGYGPKGSTPDPEAEWLFEKLDDLIVKASPKKKPAPGTLV